MNDLQYTEELVDNINETLTALHARDNIAAIEMLSIITTLMNELDTKRFNSAEYSRKFEIGRLKVQIDFTK